jgi:hypothetical protein
MHTLAAPANAHDIISVASADNAEQNVAQFEVEQLDEPLVYTLTTGADAPPTAGESDPLALPLESEVELGDGELDVGYFGCEAEDWVEFPDDHTALVERGHCTFAQKYTHAADAGATGVLIYNNVPGLINPTIGGAGVPGVWSAFVDDIDGNALASLLEDGETVVLGFTDEFLVLPVPTVGLASAFTSYGIDVELGFGPSIMAPGGFILSTIPLGLGGYGSSSGTSMSAPHVAGAVALLLESDPDLDPFQVRDRIQNTAEPAPWFGNPNFVEPSFRQGAGMLQIDRAILAEQAVEPAQIAVGEGTDPVTTTLTVTNDGAEAVTYSLSHAGTIGTVINQFVPVFWGPESEGSHPEEITVPAGGSTSFDVTITPPDGELPHYLYGGYFFLAADDGEDVLVVPYAGHDGDYSGAYPLLGFWTDVRDEDGVLIGFENVEVDPVLARSEIVDDEEQFFVVEPGHEYRPRAGDEVIVAPFFGHFPQELRLTVHDQRRGRSHVVHEQENVPRSSELISRLIFRWDGRIPAGGSDVMRPAPPGPYTVELEALRTLGDPDNLDHWDTWESFEINISNSRRP